jgi:hypothetical protein
VQSEESTPQGDVIEQARRRAAVVRGNVEQALLLAEEQGGPFDFLSVAIAAHCSVGYLRHHREFATRIRALQATVPGDGPTAQDGDADRQVLRQRVTTAERRVAELSDRVARLDAENARLRGRLAVRSVEQRRTRPA